MSTLRSLLVELELMHQKIPSQLIPLLHRSSTPDHSEILGWLLVAYENLEAARDLTARALEAEIKRGTPPAAAAWRADEANEVAGQPVHLHSWKDDAR